MTQTEKESRLRVLLELHNHPELKKEPMVCKVWHDGEITLEKGGELYGSRTLHCIRAGADSFYPEWETLLDKLAKFFPNKCGRNGYVITTKEGAAEIRDLIIDNFLDESAIKSRSMRLNEERI